MKINIFRLLLIWISLSASIINGQTASQLSVRDFGAKGDGITLDTKAIQNAIDECSSKGGSVLFPPGKYLTGGLELKDNVDIYLSNGALILGSTDVKDYKEHQPAIKSYNDIFLKYSLLYAEKVKNISIRGEGTIDGQGASFKVTTKIKPDRYRDRPYIIRFIQCENVKLENVTLQNSAMWMQHYLVCTGLTLRGIKVYNHANQNNDMMDIDGCKNVLIENCIGDTDDDAITLKSTSPVLNENIVINNCIVSSHCNAIKMGTESTGGFKNIIISDIIVKPSADKEPFFGTPAGTSGITLATVDGGIIDGVIISNIKIDGPEIPIFLRLGNRGRKHTESAPAPTVGIFKNVQISSVIATNVKNIGCSIMGLPEHYIEDVTFSNIRIIFSGGVSKTRIKNDLPELEDAYPEGNMWGILPSYGFYIRHAKGIKFDGITISTASEDQRPAIMLNDAEDIRITSLDASVSKEANCLIGIDKSNNILVENSRASGGAQNFVSVSDADTKNIFLFGNDFRGFKNPAEQKKKGQVKLISNIE